MPNPQSGENLASFIKRFMGEPKLPPRPIESMYRKKKKRKA